MTLQPVVWRDGQFVSLAPLSEEEKFEFRPPIGNRIVHHTLHSEAATLPNSFAGKKVREVFFKISFFGYSERAFRRLQGLTELGLGSTEPVAVKGRHENGELIEVAVRPRDVLSEVLLRSDVTQKGENPGFKDIATVIEGTDQSSRPLTIRVDTVAWPHPDYGVSGGTLVVGVPPAVVARWLAAGEVAVTGVHPPETSVDPERFFKELSERDITTELTVTEQFA
jgi:saccharopine dehydrogenase (NAD+, L-lysine-forming)